MSIISEKCYVGCSQFLIFLLSFEIELLPLRAACLFSKVPSLAGEGYQISLRGWGVEAHTATNPEARPLITFETNMATLNAKRSISAILQENKGL